MECIPVLDVEGNFNRSRAAITNITARVRAEAQLSEYSERLEEMVGERTAELQVKQAQLIHAGRLASLGEMSTGVAHELNQPLSVILSLRRIHKVCAESTKLHLRPRYNGYRKKRGKRRYDHTFRGSRREDY